MPPEIGPLAVTMFALVFRPEVAGAAAVMTGLAMVAFEFVEIGVVGFSLLECGVGEPVACLQVVYIGIGLITAGIAPPRPMTAAGATGRHPTRPRARSDDPRGERSRRSGHRT